MFVILEKPNELYYEAIFIEYAIMEERTESLLKHAGVKYDEKTKISQKLNKIKSNPKFENKYCKKHIPNDFVDELYKWKMERDRLIHALVKYTYDYDDLRNIALSGEVLSKKLASKSKLVNGYFDKQNAE